MRHIRTTAGLSVVVLVAFAVFPVHASGDWREFIPKIYDYSAELELGMTYQYNKNTTENAGLTTTDLFLRERINLYLNGFVYHPRFIVYSLKLSEGIKEEDYTATSTVTSLSSGLTVANSTEYELRITVLPEHPYNLEIFAIRTEPLTIQALAPQINSISYSEGAIFRYKQKPYFVDLSYVNTETESGQVNYDQSTYHASGVYYKEYSGGQLLSFSAAYNHTDITSRQTTFTGTTDDASLSNNLVYKNFYLGSSLVYSSLGQSGSTLSAKDKTLSWTENLHVSLPWNFGTNFSYVLSKSQSNFESSPSSELTNSSTTQNFRVDVNNRLYDSLFTQYTFNTESLDSTTGNSSVTTNTISTNYSKKIPEGRLMAGASYSIVDTSTIGAPNIPSEPHPAVPVPGSFNLLSQNVNTDTIMIFVRDPQAPFDLIALSENVDYTITVVGTTVKISILTLPPSLPVPGTYDFIASYNLVESTANIQTKNISFNINLNLFKDLLQPYYTYYSTRQTLLSGTFNGVPLDETLNTLGIIVSRAPWNFLFEYQDDQSNISPYRSWRAELRYMKDLAFNTNFQAGVRYWDTNYLQGVSLPTTPYTDKVAGADLSIQHRFVRRDMSISLTGSYTHETAQATSQTYSGTFLYSWTTKKFILTTGATLSSSTSEILNITSRRIYDYFYLNVKRKLF